MALDLVARSRRRRARHPRRRRDLIFPHHEDEIAQSCAYTGKPDFARYWMHGEFLNIRGSKMSKRFGNYTTPRDLKADGVDAGAVRLLVFQTHYRQKLDLTDDALDGRARVRGAGREFGDRLARATAGPGSRTNGRRRNAPVVDHRGDER
jgi:cysteinyl-tRNA synthetase